MLGFLRLKHISSGRGRNPRAPLLLLLLLRNRQVWRERLNRRERGERLCRPAEGGGARAGGSHMVYGRREPPYSEEVLLNRNPTKENLCRSGAKTAQDTAVHAPCASLKTGWAKTWEKPLVGQGQTLHHGCKTHTSRLSTLASHSPSASARPCAWRYVASPQAPSAYHWQATPASHVQGSQPPRSMRSPYCRLPRELYPPQPPTAEVWALGWPGRRR